MLALKTWILAVEAKGLADAVEVAAWLRRMIWVVQLSVPYFRHELGWAHGRCRPQHVTSSIAKHSEGWANQQRVPWN